MQDYDNIEGKLIVCKGFTLIDHFRALSIGQSCYVYLRDYNRNVIRVTAAKLKKEGYQFTTKIIRRGRQKPEKVKVTRIEYDDLNSRT